MMMSPSPTGFLRCLFAELERQQVRYCVLHGYRSLPDELASDLDMALHPSDVSKLGPVFDGLRRQGYQPLQWINYSAGAGGSHYIVLAGLRTASSGPPQLILRASTGRRRDPDVRRRASADTATVGPVLDSRDRHRVPLFARQRRS